MPFSLSKNCFWRLPQKKTCSSQTKFMCVCVCVTPCRLCRDISCLEWGCKESGRHMHCQLYRDTARNLSSATPTAKSLQHTARHRWGTSVRQTPAETRSVLLCGVIIRDWNREDSGILLPISSFIKEWPLSHTHTNLDKNTVTLPYLQRLLEW